MNDRDPLNDPLNDLFSGYPDKPGHRGVDTSIAAANDMASKAGRLQALALQAIKDAAANGLTSDELAERLGIARDSIQPRTSELRSKRLIGDSGQRRPNGNMKRCIVWIAREYLERAEAA